MSLNEYGWRIELFIGLQVKPVNVGIFISQDNCVKNLVKKFSLNKAFRTSMAMSIKIRKDEQSKDFDPSLYKSTIGSLLYLIVGSPDITCSVGMCARYQANIKESYSAVVKRVIRYVNSISGFGLWYTKDSNLHCA